MVVMGYKFCFFLLENEKCSVEEVIIIVGCFVCIEGFDKIGMSFGILCIFW